MDRVERARPDRNPKISDAIRRASHLQDANLVFEFWPPWCW